MANSAGVQATVHLSKFYLGQTEHPTATLDGSPFEFTLKIGNVNADGSRTLAEV
jgi:hypothetical protein